MSGRCVLASAGCCGAPLRAAYGVSPFISRWGPYLKACAARPADRSLDQNAISLDRPDPTVRVSSEAQDSS